MNEQDKRAYMDYLKAPKRSLSEIPSDQQTWQAALEYARGKQEPVAFVDANGDLIAKVKLEPWTDLYTNPAPAVAQEPVYIVGKGWQCEEDLEAGTKLYTHQAQPVQPNDLRQAALIDLAYINGAKAGWNMCVADDESQFQKLTEGVAECVNVLKNTRSQATAHPDPAVAQIIPGDSLFHCVSDLENSATYDSHSEMQNCIRSVAQRIKALAGKAPAVAVNEQMLDALYSAQNVIDNMEQNYGNLWQIEETPESLDAVSVKIGAAITAAEKELNK